MHELPAYERDPYMKELTTQILETGAEGGRPFAVLADTVLYPEGGGQPADLGWLGEVEVVDVQRRERTVRHVLARPVEPGPVTVRLDWGRRFDHMQQHTGQHLLTAVAADRFGWPTTAFHLGERVCDVELDVRPPAAAALAALEEAVAERIRAALPVSTRRVNPAEFATLAVRTRGLPAGHAGDVRLVEIAGIDLNTCGGTHVRSTAEIEAIKLLGVEPMRGGTRLAFVAGGRVRARLGAHEARNTRLRALFGAPDEELAAVAEAKLEQLQAAEKRTRGLEEELAGAVAATLAAEREGVVSAHFEGRDAAFLQALARRFVAGAPAKAALLTASDGDRSSFALAFGEDLHLDVQAAGREVAVLLDGRGGGSGRIFQGKAGSLERRAGAVARLRELAASGGVKEEKREE
ncbi:MAG: alanyl-tRNA editing protein [Thermoanaerobaculaceae bacterium]|nr:alanyl-tRNA editing protein [Thermoanaerobaculaceae bacterium]